jgi:hypothetical protein
MAFFLNINELKNYDILSYVLSLFQDWHFFFPKPICQLGGGENKGVEPCKGVQVPNLITNYFCVFHSFYLLILF